MATLLTTITYGDIEIKIYGEELPDGGVKLSYEGNGGFDVAGLFVDLGNDGGDLKSAKDAGYGKEGGGLNLNGADSDTGEKLDGWDNIFMTSSPGLKGADGVDSGDTDVNGDSMVLANVSLADLAGAQFGVKLQSVDALDGGSLKLTNTVPDDFDPGGEPDLSDFPTWPQDISHITLYFDTNAVVEVDDEKYGDVKPKSEGDGYYTVKIDEVPGIAPDDLDDPDSGWLDEVLDWLNANDPIFSDPDLNFNAEDLLLGVAIKGGTTDETYYAYGDNNLNGALPDPDLIPTGSLVVSSDVDQTYDYGDIIA